MACSRALPNWENGAAGSGLVRASFKARTAMMAASKEDVFGTGHWCGKITLFWRCARILFLGHRVGSNDSVLEQDLNTSC